MGEARPQSAAPNVCGPTRATCVAHIYNQPDRQRERAKCGLWAYEWLCSIRSMLLAPTASHAATHVHCPPRYANHPPLSVRKTQ